MYRFTTLSVAMFACWALISSIGLAQFNAPKFQLPPQIHVNRGGLGFQTNHDGQSQSGYVHRNGAGYQSSSPNGGKQSGYVNRNGAGYQSNASNGQSQSGYINRLGGGYEQRGQGQSRQGGSFQGGGNWNAGFQNFDYAGNGYGGNAQRIQGGVGVDGQYNTPISGTPLQSRNQGTANFRGRDSNAQLNSNVFLGGVNLGGTQQNLDRRQYSQSNTINGPVRGSTGYGVKFGGVNSTATYNQGYQVPGVGGYKANVVGNRSGVQATGQVSVFGKSKEVRATFSPKEQQRRLSSITKVNVPTPTIPRPKAPSLPKVSTPSFSTKSFGF